MKQADFLQPGDSIGIVATARKMPLERLELGVAAIEHYGFKAIVSEHASNAHFIFAGNDEQRARALQQMLDNPDIKAIWCARGGYGTLRILDQLDWTSFKKRPKWLIGFSDITNLHVEINDRLEHATIHGPMPINLDAGFAKDESVQKLFTLLKGSSTPYEWPITEDGLHGNAIGKLVGGNLANLSALSGSVSKEYFHNALLFVEDIDEYLYQIDRMLRSMKKAGCFDKLKGVIVGQFTDIKDNDDPFGSNLQEIFAEVFGGYNLPIAFGFQAGHEQPNWPLVLGSNYQLDSSLGFWKLTHIQSI